MKIKIRRLNNDAVVPTKGSLGAAGFDLYVSESDMVCKGSTTLFKTGLSIELPVGYEGQVRSRSGLSKAGLVVANSPGTIDCDYRGEIGILIHNQGEFNKIIPKGTRVAQLVIQKVEDISFEEVSELSETERNEGGFGSTGTI